MGERITVQVFRGLSQSEFRAAWERAVAELRGAVRWDTDPEPPMYSLRTVQGDGVTSVLLPRYPGHFPLCAKVAEMHALAWMALRIQEGSLWDYTLMHGADVVDQFSTLPEYWDGDDPQARDRNKGDSALLARLWSVPQNRIKRYLTHWGYEVTSDTCYNTTRCGKAYPDDQHEYGDIWQMVDFLHSIGGDYPVQEIGVGQQHAMMVPMPPHT
ncbi:MAG: hypothetical protein HKN37_13730 [Rhodothermales bacterium]|nr:hypothetical protein [Acidimicrobiia bacterium]NNE47709.1 hypothetical protein [Rhodothermales bacterium]